MILAVDIRNTQITFGCMDGEQVTFSERVKTDPARTELEYAMSLRALMEIYEVPLAAVDGAIISSVVPSLTDVMKNALGKMFHIRPYVVGPGLKTGLNIQMDNPAQVGSDLIANAVAGLKEYGAPLLIIDMGTATTISVLGENKAYIGGVIMPGLAVSMEGLVNNASLLPDIRLAAPNRVLGKNTIDSMRSGLIFGQAAGLDGMIDRIFEEVGCEMPIVATGKLSVDVLPACRHSITRDEQLTLKGLNYIYKKNQEG